MEQLADWPAIQEVCVCVWGGCMFKGHAPLAHEGGAEDSTRAHARVAACRRGAAWRAAALGSQLCSPRARAPAPRLPPAQNRSCAPRARSPSRWATA